MSYRKINVDGIIYEYTVGKSGLKVKGLGYITNNELSGDWWNLNPIKPADVARFIREDTKLTLS